MFVKCCDWEVIGWVVYSFIILLGWAAIVIMRKHLKIAYKKKITEYDSGYNADDETSFLFNSPSQAQADSDDKDERKISERIATTYNNFVDSLKGMSDRWSKKDTDKEPVGQAEHVSTPNIDSEINLEISGK